MLFQSEGGGEVQPASSQDDSQYIFDTETGHMIMAPHPSSEVSGDVMMNADGLMLPHNPATEVRQDNCCVVFRWDHSVQYKHFFQIMVY